MEFKPSFSKFFTCNEMFSNPLNQCSSSIIYRIIPQTEQPNHLILFLPIHQFNYVLHHFEQNMFLYLFPLQNNYCQQYSEHTLEPDVSSGKNISKTLLPQKFLHQKYQVQTFQPGNKSVIF